MIRNGHLQIIIIMDLNIKKAILIFMRNFQLIQIVNYLQILRKQAAATKGKYEKKKIRPDNVKPDPDFFELGPNQRSKLERYLALKSKFEQNPDLKKLLIETKDAKLVNFVRSSPPITDLELMNVRKEIINTENV